MVKTPAAPTHASATSQTSAASVLSPQGIADSTEPSIAIPPFLASEVQSGKVVLILGAGASFGASHPESIEPPSGKDLAKRIAEEFLGGDHANDSLSSVADMAIAVSDYRKVQRFVSDQVREFGPGEHHLLLPTFRWHGIATLNYDEIVEKAYEKERKKLYVMRSNHDDFETANKDTAGTTLLKLHGCITRDADPHLPMILTPSQYADHQRNRDRLFGTLRSWGADRTLVFCGTTIDDSDIHVLLRDIVNSVKAHPHYYLVEPYASEHQVKRWSKHNIGVLKGSFAAFLHALDAATPGVARNIALPVQDVPLLAHISLTSVTINDDVRRELRDDIEIVGPGVAATATNPQMFYSGHSGDWSPIINDLDCPREIADDILIEVVLESKDSRPANLVVLKAEAGAGKSVLMRRIAWRIATELNKLSLWATRGSGLSTRALEIIGPAIKDRLYLFVDNLTESARHVAQLLARARALSVPLTVMGAARSNEWNVNGHPLLPYVDEGDEYEVPRLSPREIDRLLTLLERHDSLYDLKHASGKERHESFARVADRQLLVALHMATRGKPLEEIIKDEYEQVVPDSAQSLYLTVCLLNQTGTPVRAGLIARVHGVPFDKFKEKFFGPLEHVVIVRQPRGTRDVEYTARHPMIAGMVIDQILADREQLYERIIMVLRHLNTLYSTDQQSFEALIRARTLRELFADPLMVHQIYDVAQEAAPGDGHVVFQRAMYEIKRDAGNLRLGEELLTEAEQLLPESPVVRHAFAELEFERGRRSPDRLTRTAALRSADQHLQGMIGRASTSHACHTKSKIDILRLETVLEDEDATPEDEVRAIQHAEEAVWNGLQQWPEHSLLLESEARLAQLLNQNDRAQKALLRAAESNLRNATVVTRLLRLYRETGKIAEARDLLRRASEAAPQERKYHYEHARLLMAENGDPAMIEELLRKSFNEGDSNRFAQFLHARQMYINDKDREARERFKSLAASVGTGIAKNEWTWRENGELVECHGRVQRVERTYGLVARDGTGEWVFVPPDENGSHPLHDLEVGARVRFNITFNFRGPVAINVRPSEV